MWSFVWFISKVIKSENMYVTLLKMFLNPLKELIFYLSVAVIPLRDITFLSKEKKENNMSWSYSLYFESAITNAARGT